MRLLLDTHVWLWLQDEPERLGQASVVMADTDNDLLLSAASSWEIAIKWKLGKLGLTDPPETYVPDRMISSGVTGLPVQHAHGLAVAGLPQHHRDPFDRMLIAQAMMEGLTLVTADDAMRAYDAELLFIP